MPETHSKSSAKTPKEKPHYHGHRARLRSKFLQGGESALADYELLEVILFAASPRADVKPLAKRLIADLGGLEKVTAASVEQLQQVDGLSDAGIAAIKAVQAAATYALRKQASERTIIQSWQALLDYLSISLSQQKIEHFRVLFLDKKHKLLADEMQSTGTIDHTPVYTREIVKRALELHASAMILVHNHPSGDPEPSQADIDLTEEIEGAACALGIALHDHVIIGKGAHFSFKSHGLL